MKEGLDKEVLMLKRKNEILKKMIREMNIKLGIKPKKEKKQ